MRLAISSNPISLIRQRFARGEKWRERPRAADWHFRCGWASETAVTALAASGTALVRQGYQSWIEDLDCKVLVVLVDEHVVSI